MKVGDIPKFEDLNDLERLALAEDILGSLRSPEALPAPSWHGEELARRWSGFVEGRTRLLTRDEFRSEVDRLRK